MRITCFEGFSIGTELNWEEFTISVIVSVTCFTRNKGISNTVGGNKARFSTYKDTILGRHGIMSYSFDVDNSSSPLAGIDGGLDNCRIA